MNSLTAPVGPALRLALFWLIPAIGATAGSAVQVKPTDPLSTLHDKLATDASITEVIFEAGTYFGGLHVRGAKEVDFSQRPLLIRAADGASVVFDGSKSVDTFERHEELTNVFWMRYEADGGEYPKFWEPRTRMRYRLVADRQSVARFPATFTIEKERVLFHPSDGRAPASGELLMSAEDCGIFVNRPYVTVRGIAFQNYVVRDKWGTAIDLRVDHITVEDCRATNCSHGFIITGNNNALRRCTTDDVGGGVYVGGENATVESCRFHKQRDTFMVPMYSQDDTAIQYYVPARGGLIRGNLCEGFGMGVFIKAHTAPYVVEHNTLVGLGQGLGFGSTSWHPEQRFRYNIIADCARQVEISTDKDSSPRDIDYNCYWSSSRTDLKQIGPHDRVANPNFVWPAWRDYRLANDSPCLKLADDAGPCGAFPAAGDSPIDFGPGRQWHVSEKGRDGLDGSAGQPVRTIQFAVDRARPGDTIIVHAGVYPDPVHIMRGGTKERPIVIRAAEPWQAVLDSNREASKMIRIENAPYIEIHGLEIRWYRNIAVSIEASPHVTMTGCRIWNAHWHGAWPTGYGVRAAQSPGFVGRDNVLFRQEHAFWFYQSPSATLTYNTCVANLYSAAAFLYSCENSVCRNNSFTFQGNDVIVIEENLGQKGKLKTFDCDYNNYGTSLREQPAGTQFDSITPRKSESFLSGNTKAIVNYTEYQGQMKRCVSLDEWRDFSGLDRHTVFADPLYRDTAGRDFRLDVNSPNRGAGVDGATIGALRD
jgi:Right handed beta helix region/Periplasmic copper-binding protein (NosD)